MHIYSEESAPDTRGHALSFLSSLVHLACFLDESIKGNNVARQAARVIDILIISYFEKIYWLRNSIS